MGAARYLVPALLLTAVAAVSWRLATARPGRTAPGGAVPEEPRSGPPVAAPGPAPGGGARPSAAAEGFWRTDDYLAYVDRYLEAALAGDAEAAYFVAMAQQACMSALGQPTLAGKAGAAEAWLARRPELSDEQAAAFRRRLGRCAGFAAAYPTEEDARALEEATDALLASAAAAGHPAAVVERRMWVADGWRDGPGRDVVLDELARAAASGHPEALRKLGEYVGGDGGVVLTLLACDAGYDCAADADWVVEYCQFGWTVCTPGADGPRALLDSLPGWRADRVRELAAALGGGTPEAFRPLLEQALARSPGAERR